MKDDQLKKVWGIPVLLSLITLFGLLAALLGTGACWVLAWLAMAVPLTIIILKIAKHGVQHKKTK